MAIQGGPWRQASGPAPSQDLSPSQQRILDFVRELPGITIQDMAAKYGCSHPTAAYHLSSLARRGLIRRGRDGRTVRHYALGAKASGEVLYVAALERDERRRRIIEFIRTENLANLSINQIRERLGLPYGLIRRTLLQLERQGLVVLHARRYTYLIELKGAWVAKDKPSVALSEAPDAAAPQSPLLTALISDRKSRLV